MKNKKTKTLDSIMVERLFWAGMIVLIAVIVIDYIFVSNMLKSQAKQIDHSRIQLKVSEEEVSKVKEIRSYLDSHMELIKKTESIVAESGKLLPYQDKIITDLQEYATKVGTTITGYSFPVPASATPAAGGAATATPAAPAAPGALALPAGVKAVEVSVTFGTKLKYEQFIYLLQLLESNVTRMQVTEVSLSPSTEDPTQVSSPNMTLQVFTRQ